MQEVIMGRKKKRKYVKRDKAFWGKKGKGSKSIRPKKKKPYYSPEAYKNICENLRKARRQQKWDRADIIEKVMMLLKLS